MTKIGKSRVIGKSGEIWNEEEREDWNGCPAKVLKSSGGNFLCSNCNKEAIRVGLVARKRA